MNWLNDFNSTNGKIIAGITMAHIVIITVCWMEMQGRHFDSVLLIECLGFVGLWAGISYAQFVKKRETFKPAYPADEDGPVPPVPTPVPVLTQADANVAAQVAAAPKLPSD